MTLEELAKIPYNRLLRLKPYTGWVKTWGWTGRYYIDGIFDKPEAQRKYMVEIRTFPFGFKEYIYIDLLKEIKEYEC